MIQLIETTRPISSLIGFYPYPETNPANAKVFEQHYLSLHFTYQVNVQVVRDPAEIFPGFEGAIVSIQEGDHSHELEDFVHPEQCIYVAGNSMYQYPADFMHTDYQVRIQVPAPDHPLYGDQAAAIVLNDRRLKNGY